MRVGLFDLVLHIVHRLAILASTQYIYFKTLEMMKKWITTRKEHSLIQKGTLTHSNISSFVPDEHATRGTCTRPNRTRGLTGISTALSYFYTDIKSTKLRAIYI